MDRLIMIVLLFIMLIPTVSIMLYYREGKKKILLAVIVIIIPFVAQRVYKHIQCGPDRKDIAVMKPQAQVVSDYILKHGIPESLAKIPDLVYALEGCERKTTYRKSTSDPIEIQIKEDASYAIIDEECTFQKDDRIYVISIFFTESYDDTIDDGNLKLINWQSSTAISYTFKSNKNHKFVLQYMSGFYSGNINGICAPFRP